LLPPRRDSVPRSLAMPCGGCSSKAMARSLSKKRAHHAKKRLQQLRGIIHELPADVLDRCNLRQLSYATKRCGGPCQLLLPHAEDGRRDLNCHASEPPAQTVTGPSWPEQPRPASQWHPSETQTVTGQPQRNTSASTPKDRSTSKDNGVNTLQGAMVAVRLCTNSQACRTISASWAAKSSRACLRNRSQSLRWACRSPSKHSYLGCVRARRGNVLCRM
jgi:hypothetical protein